MSRLRQVNGDDYPDAAEKHLLDSGSLLAGDGTTAPPIWRATQSSAH